MVPSVSLVSKPMSKPVDCFATVRAEEVDRDNLRHLAFKARQLCSRLNLALGVTVLT